MSTKEFSFQNIVIDTHLWLGLCAAFCTWGTFVLLNQPVSFLYIGFVVAGTMTIYNFHGIYSQKENSNDSKPNILGVVYQKGILLGGCLITIATYFLLPRYVQLILVFPVLMALVYVLPVYHGKRLKDYPFVKIIAIVMAWTTVTYWIPVHHISQWWTEQVYQFFMLDRLLFFFALAIPFDIRDMAYDKGQHLRTIPNTIGLHNSQFLALFSLFMAGGFMAMGNELLGTDSRLKIGLLLVYFLAGIFIIRLKKMPSAGFYSWYVDGILFAYGIVILFLSG